MLAKAQSPHPVVNYTVGAGAGKHWYRQLVQGGVGKEAGDPRKLSAPGRASRSLTLLFVIYILLKKKFFTSKYFGKQLKAYVSVNISSF